MSFSQIIDELPNLTPQERLQVAEQALALDTLSPVDEALVEQRLAAHQQDPASSIPLDDFLTQLRSRYGL
jgi:hypothetical protein